jgi:hypothetical protein
MYPPCASPAAFLCPSADALDQEEAFEESQHYKVGKFILEKTKLAKKSLPK